MTAAMAARAETTCIRARDTATGGLMAGLLFLAAAGMARAETVITSHGISTFGDLQLAADFAHLPYVNPDAPKGGELVQWWSGGFDSMNPYSVKGRAAIGSNMMLESILTATADEIGAAYCLLCTTMEYPEDRSWVIFNLRDDVKFSDGTPMTAEDVAFSYETLLNKGLQDFRTVFATQVEGYEILGPHRIKFTFKADVPWRDLPETMGGLPVFSRAQFEAEGLDLGESTLKAYIGTGPYAFDSMDAGKSVTYRRNPDYWGQNLPFNIGQNNFDLLRWEYFGDQNAAFEGFKAGIYTFRSENSSRQWATGYDFPAIKNGAVLQDEIANQTKASGQGFIFNLRRTKWQDPKVRQAIGLMFNYEWTNKTLFYGQYQRIDSFWENSWLEASGAPSPAEVAILQPLVDDDLLPASILTDEPVMPPVSSPDRQLDRKNLRAASALLDEAGWIAGADGMRRNDKGELLSIEFLNDDAQFERLIAPYVENLRALGVDAKLVNIDQAQFEERTVNPAYDFDIITDHARTNYFSGAELKQFYGSETADVSAFNTAGLKDPAVDRLIEVLMAAKTKDELTEATHALDRVLRHIGFRVPQWYNGEYWVAYYDMYDHPENMPPYALGVESIWWYNAEKGDALKAKGVLR